MTSCHFSKQSSCTNSEESRSPPGPDLTEFEIMGSLTPDLFVLIGLLAMDAYLLISVFGINRNRRIRNIKRRVTERLLNWAK